MALKDILAVSGHSGLYKLVSQARNGIIVESLADGKRTHISASAKVSALSDISIFTDSDEKPLNEVLNTIKEQENGQPTISHKSSNEEMKTFFAKVVPNYDTDRVYASDIKKVVAWYNQLQSASIMDFSSPDDEEIEEKPDGEGDTPSESGEEKKAKAKPKGTTAKKTPPKPKGQNEAKKRVSSKPQATRKPQTPRKGE